MPAHEPRRSSHIDCYAFVDHGDAFAEFRKIFKRNPDITKDIVADDLPVPFRIKLAERNKREQVAASFRTLPGVDDVVINETQAERERRAKDTQSRPACGPQDYDQEVFLRLDITVTSVEALRTAIAEIPGVEVVRSIDHDQAFIRASCLFAGTPKALAGLTPGDFPESFQLHVTGDSGSIVEQLRALPDVEEVLPGS